MGEKTLTLSGIIEKDGEKKACICFTDGERSAEGYIPDCKITSYKGFSTEEIEQLETYLMANLADLKKQAAVLSPFGAMMKD